MSFRRLVPMMALLAVFAMALRFSIGPDTYWHLRAGDWMLTEGRLLTTDPFSLTAFGSEWIYPGWLAQVSMIAIYRALGFPGLNLLTALVVTAAFGLVWMTMRGSGLLRAFVLLLAVTVSAVYWSARPHIFTFLFTAVSLWILSKYRRQPRSRVIWVLPVLTAVWANMHGGFIIPVLLIGLELAAMVIDMLLPKLRIAIQSYGGLQVPGGVSEPVTTTTELPSSDEAETGAGGPDRDLGPSKTLVGVGLASVAAMVVNPFGVDILAYPFRTVSIEVLQNYIQEWQSPNFHQIEVQPFLWLLLLAVAAMAISPKRPMTIELIHIGVFAYLGFLAARNIALFALVAGPVLSRHSGEIIAKWFPRRQTSQQLSPRITRPINMLLLVLVAIAVLLKGARPFSAEFNEETIEASMPMRAVEFVRATRPEGPLFNSYNWGGYLLWSLYPDYLSYVDGRTDLFDDIILEEYLDVWRGEDGWKESFREWDIQLVLVELDAPLVRELLRAGWTSEYADDQAHVLSSPK